MTVTAADYLWSEEKFPDLAEAYCITLVNGIAPSQVLDRLGGDEHPALTGTAAVVEAAYNLDDTRQLIAMAGLGSWTVMIEANGYLGVSEERVLPASSGTTWISHFCNVDALDSFLWVEDTTTRLVFEPMFPDARWGSHPDDQLGAMHRVGFHFGTEERDIEQPVAAAFALADVITGVHLTPELLETASFTCGTVRRP